jgi:hypothetical protein
MLALQIFSLPPANHPSLSGVASRFSLLKNQVASRDRKQLGAWYFTATKTFKTHVGAFDILIVSRVFLSHGESLFKF